MMIDLSKCKEVNLPDTITVRGTKYKVRTSFRYGIMFSALIEKRPLLKDFVPFFEDFYHIPVDMQAAVDELMKFYFPEEPLPNKDVIINSDVRTSDYILDSSAIYAAFRQQYNIDLIDEDMHWYKFRALFNNLKDTRLNEIMGYRCYNPNDKSDEKKFYLKQKQLWEIREEMDEEEQAAVDKFNSQFD